MRSFGAWRYPVEPWTPDWLHAEPECVFLGHTWGGTDEIPWRLNGIEQFPLRVNPDTGRHGSFAVVPEGTACEIEVTLPGGRRLGTSITTPTVASRWPTRLRDRWVAPGVSAGQGSYTELDPGNFASALQSAISGDYIICKDGTYNGFVDLSTSATDYAIIAADGATPIFNGEFYQGSVNWRDDGNLIYSTTDFIAETRQVLAEVGGSLERFSARSSLAELQSEGDGWVIEGGRLHIGINDDPALSPVHIPGVSGPDFLQLWGDGVFLQGLTWCYYGAPPSGSSNIRGVRLEGNNVTVLDCECYGMYKEGLRLGSGTNFYVQGFKANRESRTYMRWEEQKGDAEVSNTIVMLGNDGVTLKDLDFGGQMDTVVVLGRSGAVRNMFVRNLHSTLDYDENMSLDGPVEFLVNLDQITLGGGNLTGYASVTVGPLWLVNARGASYGLQPPKNAAAPNRVGQGTKWNSNNVAPVAQIHFLNCTCGPVADPNAVTSTRAWSVDGPAGPDDFNMSDCYMRNCIWDGADGRPFHDESLVGNYNIDHNLYWTTKVGDQFLWLNTSQDTFADFQAASGQEPNGEFRDPGLLSNGLPVVPIAGTYIPGVTYNPLLGDLRMEKGAQ